MYAFRFMVGLFESAFSPVITFLIVSWYSKAELGKRIAIWHLTELFGSATSGFLAAGVYASLDGHMGIAGWRWLYISKFPQLTPRQHGRRSNANA
jgi:MFS transporter, ACS family, pantothenate transporter